MNANTNFDINEYFHIGKPEMPLTVQKTNTPTGITKNYPNQASTAGDSLIDVLNDFTGMRFQNIGDFFSYYRQNFFKTAYNQLGMNPYGCFQLAIGNPWVKGAVDAISKPIGSATITAVPRDEETKPNSVFIPYMEDLMAYPNPTPNAAFFHEQITKDRKRAGTAYVEVNYGESGFPARFDRISPAQIEIKRKGGMVYYVKDNGYIFSPENLIVIMEENPIDNFRGLSPLVALFNHMMLDESMTEHNLRFFTKDMLKGLISLDRGTYPNAKTAEDEAKRLQRQIMNMQEKGESGHLLVYGATFQAMTTNNRDMLTPTISQNIIDAVKTVYRVPQGKLMFANGGSIGNGEGETQEDTMNETLIDEMSYNLKFFNNFFARVVGIKDTVFSYDNLTNTDLTRQANLDDINIKNGSTTWNSVKQARGEDPYDFKEANEPLVPANMIPLSWMREQYETPGTAQASVVGGEAAQDQNEILNTMVRQRVKELCGGI